MRLAFSALAFLSFALLNSGCDLTQGMAGKMDQTNAQLDNTSAKMDQTNNTLGVVAAATHKQIMSGGLDDMVTDENTKTLVPVPFGMLPGGKTFAEEAHEDDLVDWFYTQYKDLTEGTADDNQRVSVYVFVPKMDATGHEVLQAQYSSRILAGHPYMVPQTSWEFPSSYVDSFNRQKDIILNEMQVVAYFIPQPMIEQIVADQIEAGGLRQQTAFLILNLRDNFSRSAGLQNGLYTDVSKKDLDQIQEGIRIVNMIDYIAHLPYVDQLSSNKIRGYIDLSAKYIYEQQALQSQLSLVVSVQNPPNPFVPVTIPFDPTQAINNTYQTYYTPGDDGITVKPTDQNAARTVAYDPTNCPKDWQTMKRHFLTDLTKDEQQSDVGQQYLAEINSHL
jgi:hypothetical protein